MVGNIGQTKTKVETLESNNNQFGKTVEKNNKNSYNLFIFIVDLKKLLGGLWAMVYLLRSNCYVFI